ncbi:MAG: hypothetical protein ABWY25_06245, partial [Paenisporosarcina sp.]
RMGFDCEAIPTASTLYGTLVRLAPRDGLYIVSVTGHFIAIEVADHHIYFCDNHTKEPMPAASSARLQQQCKAVHRVEKRRDPVLLSTEIVPDIGRDSDGKIVVRLIQYFVYDIEKWNKDILIVKFKLDGTYELNKFINSLSDQAETL